MGRKLSRADRDLKLAARALSLALLVLPAGARAQERDARGAQADFERTRVARLPWSREPAGGPCDEIVGRFCYRDEPERDRSVPDEPVEVASARDSLLGILDAAARADPRNGWLAGQQVRYRIEGGRKADAIEIAIACRAEPWWCAGLEGAARHAAGEFAAAERAFERSLAAMPAGERERWDDVEPLLDARSRRVWRGLGGGARRAFARRMWWAADPLWSVPGNERRTEHFARHVWDRMQEDSASPYGVSWGEDLSELLVRYGWPSWWERTRGDLGRLGGSGRPGVVAHDAPGAKRFVPDLEAIADPAVASAKGWPLDAPAPRSTYAPAYARRFLALEPQLARFRREGDAVVVAGWELPPDLRESAVAAAIFASEGPDRPFVTAGDSASGAGGSLRIAVPWRRVVVGVEVRGIDLAGRWRGGLDLPAGRSSLPALSDLLLLASPESLPVSLEQAIPRARRSAVAAPGERLGIFWEVYPLGAEVEPVTITLAIRGRESDPGALRWSETLPPRAAVVPRAVALQLPELPRGEYVLQVEVAWPDGVVRRSRRALAIRP